ncbi:AraC-like DNA-binding protein [Parvibaculum indicum]|uniref:helix-turn-helix transcriptional regulator n=1 Tax=Parvibaculum indicum TaxID=562969 RepID=UPI00141DAE48|nr:AraC family transcriptional regulator [Parvibaculum indicum]NIJ42990.1 AraC-like DNA-binding protein [Parvibaculum indicum]
MAPADPPSPRTASMDYLPRQGFRLIELRDGLSLHSSDGMENGLSTPPARTASRLVCSLVLDGSLEGIYDNHVVPFGGHSGPARHKACGTLVSLREPVSFSRRGLRGTRTRKVNITLQMSWLEKTGLLELGRQSPIGRFTRSHLAVRHWVPNRRAVQIAEEILRPCPVTPELETLYLESRAIELLLEGTGSLADRPGDAGSAGLRRKARDIEDFLIAHLHQPLTLDEIARALAMSPSSLQRACRSVYGTSVFDLLRKLRLDTARHRLAEEGISVAEAAYIAGYGSPANFATAFRRAYGVSPSEARRAR